MAISADRSISSNNAQVNFDIYRTPSLYGVQAFTLDSLCHLVVQLDPDGFYTGQTVSGYNPGESVQPIYVKSDANSNPITCALSGTTLTCTGNGGTINSACNSQDSDPTGSGRSSNTAFDWYLGATTNDNVYPAGSTCPAFVIKVVPAP